MIKKTKLKAVFLAVGMSVMSISGCQNKSASVGSTKIYYAAIESGDYYEGWASQLEDQAQKMGADFEVGYAENSIETQVAQIKEAAGSSNVILCGSVSADVVSELEAAAKDTPIVFINNAPDDGQLEKDRYIYVASDEYMAGQYQAEYILEHFADKNEINVAILKGPKDASGAIGRTNGLKRTLNASGKKINYVFEDFANWSTDTAQEFMSLFLKTGSPVDCVAANNDDMALGAVSAFENAGYDTQPLLFLGVDASENGCQAIVDGRMDFTVYQPMSSQITSAVEAAVKMANGESIEDIEWAVEDGKYILLPFEKVDAGNVAQYQ
ncbi:MAG: substrate-binding domain-containing protein [Lachnospiraceae bacterium]|nr:substrate-binding domain-containing protein [Lachnospiraceae bacterium]